MKYRVISHWQLTAESTEKETLNEGDYPTKESAIEYAQTLVADNTPQSKQDYSGDLMVAVQIIEIIPIPA